MTISQYRELSYWHSLAMKAKEQSARSFPSRRQAKNTSHGDMKIIEKNMRIIPGVKIER